MSKENRKKAVQGEIHRDGQTVKMEPCPVEGCNHFIDPKSDLGLCSECDRIGRVVNYGTTQILLNLGIIRKKNDPPKKQESQGPILLIPKPGLERAAIKQAAQAAGVNQERTEKGGRS